MAVVDFLVRPVVSKGVESVSLYLPSGYWVHLWSGEEFSGGRSVRVDAPVGEPPVFYRADSEVARSVVENLKAEDLV